MEGAGGAGVSGQPVVDFAGLLRQLRAQAGLTQEELAEAARLSPRAVSDLERGIHRTARKDTALLLAGALGLDGPVRELFVAAARGRAPAAEVLAAVSGLPGVGGMAGRQAGSPYRGLKAFGEQDAGWFFGREAATTAVADRMAGLLAGAGVLVVSGASGAGKSSLLRAGLVPRLRAAGLAGVPGAAWWPQVVFTPTRAPLEELALQVAALAGADAAGVARELAAHPEGFALTARQAALARPRGPAEAAGGEQRRRRRLLLVVDQFEELFTQCDQEGQRRVFIAALHAAASTGHGLNQAPAALVVLGVRADFEARCADYPQLAGPVQDRYLVTAMTERQLRLAITEPAKKAGSAVDDDLVAVLLAEIRNGQPGTTGAGALPLLSHALDQAWRHRAGETVTLADYERTGGIEGAVAATAQRAYDQLTPAQQAAARQVFTRLAATSSDGIDTADRANRADLTIGKTPTGARDVEAVLEAFAAERLLTLSASTVELSHEVLLTAWPLLRDTWLADTHADRIIRTRLHHTAAEWDHHQRDPSYLYTGTLLQAATAAAARIGADPARHPPLGPAETDFLHASEQAHHRRARRWQAAIAGLVALTLAAVTAAGIAFRTAAAAAHNAANARRQHTIALSRQLAAEGLSVASINPVIARRLAVAAWRIFPTGQASAAMTTLLAGQQQNGILPADPSGVSDVAFSPNGKLLASADADGTVRLWNPATGEAVGAPLQTGSGSQGGVSAVAFSPDGKLLASADGDGTMRLWNPATGRQVGAPIPVTNALNGVHGVAFSRGGTLLASAVGDGTVRLWDPATRRLIGAPIQTGTGTGAVAFSPGGTLLAIGSGDGTVRQWNPATGQPASPPIQTGSGPYGGVATVAFSPDGTLLASGDSDGTVRLWNPATRRPVAILHATSARSGGAVVAFSPDGKRLAAGGGDNMVRLWNPATGRLVATLHASAYYGARAVAFSHNGKLLASAGGDGTVRLWNPATGRALATLQTGTGPNTGVYGVAFSPDGKLLAAGCGDGTVRLWNPATRRPIATLHVVSVRFGTDAVAFTPDGKLLVTGSGDGTVRAWNPATRQPVGAPIQTSALNAIFVVVFSPDGTLLASGGNDGIVRVWQASLFAHTYAQLCADVGPPTPHEWNHYAPGESQPKVCG